jgi:hypothetical protein
MKLTIPPHGHGCNVDGPGKVFLAILLVSAGRLSYWQAWEYAAIGTVMNLCTRLILRGAPDVAKERARPGEGAKGWYKALHAGRVVTQSAPDRA